MRHDKERDKIDDILNSKLYDFEADVAPDDWEKIAGRLPESRMVSFRRKARYYWAAASLLAILSVGVFTHLSRHENQVVPLAKQAEQTIEKQIQKITEAEAPVEIIPTEKKIVARATRLKYTACESPQAVSAEPRSIVAEETESETKEVVDDFIQSSKEEPSIEANVVYSDSQADVLNQVSETKKEKVKRWSFGTGGGSVTAGTSNSLSTYAFKNTQLENVELATYNAPYAIERAPKTNIHHNVAFSWGLGVSYALNERWSLQSGLNYSFLKSDWETNGNYHSKTKQKLHFIGLPLSVTYKIAEWKRFRFYGSAGAMTEMNITGNVTTKNYVGEELLGKKSEHLRMKELLWSLNAGVGVSYPLLRFMSAYVETGVDYYFDNGSTIETVRSEKPFNVKLQAGLRLGF